MKHDTPTSKLKMIDALERSLGIVTPACKEVGISRNAFYEWMKEDPEFKKKVDEVYEVQGDFVENQLFKKIKEGSERSIMFYMRYKGKKRGYTDSMDITTGGKSIDSIRVIQIKSKDELDGIDD